MILNDGVAIFLDDASRCLFLREELKKSPQYKDSFFIVDSLSVALTYPVCVISWEDFLSVPLADKRGSSVVVYGPPSCVAKAFSLGCSDYLKEPWALDELVARCLRFLRRSIKSEFLELSFDNTEIVANGVFLRLSPARKNLMLLFLKNCGLCVPKGAIAMAVGSKAGGSRAVDMQVAILRKELAACLPGLEDCVVSVTRKGYVFAPERFCPSSGGEGLA